MSESQTSTVRSVPIDRLRTSFARLRPGESLGAPEQLAELPLRVVPAGDDGCFEVLDGFKRLQRWRAQGAIVSSARTGPVAGVGGTLGGR